MTILKLSGIVALAGCLLTVSGGAMAGTKVGEVDLSGNVALVSDYVWRGISQTDEDPAVQGGFDAAHDLGFYAGVWGSNVDFNDGDEASVEIDLYGGFGKTFDNKVSIDVGVIRYAYPSANDALEYDFTEFYLGAGYTFDPVSLRAKYSFTPDYSASLADDSASYLEGNADVSLPEGFVLSGHLGYSFGDHFENVGHTVGSGNLDSYADYSLGVSKELAGFGLSLAVTGVDGDGEDYFGRLADDRILAKVSRKF